jgi:SAM-dependent methyltransferase
MSTGPELPAQPSGEAETVVARRAGFILFLTGFLVLFLELACIRWFATYVIFLQFFTNVVLIACFLGMSCGCLMARNKRDWLALFPLLGMVTFLAALGSLLAFRHWSGLAVDVGNQTSPEVVFFGTERDNMDVARFVVPIEVLAAVFFTLIALLFVGLGQALGRAIEAYPNRVLGYTLNIGGSLAGIAVFSAVSFAQLPPVAWFLVAFAGIAWLLRQGGRLNWFRGILLATLVALTAIPAGFFFEGHSETRWSPYYAVVRRDSRIDVNTIGHQSMVPFNDYASAYSLIHLLQKHSGGKPFENILVIGAGSGNDVAHSLRYAAKRIDAVEIDPVIQDIGIHHHPDHPYQDPRVVRHVDDGRHFLRTTDQKYDLVIYALVDSLILHSSYASIRLESFLFTDEAFADVRRVLKPDGVFVSYNFFRQGWIVHRIAAISEHAFGSKPVVISLKKRVTLSPEDQAKGLIVVISGNTGRIADAFAKSEYFRLYPQPPLSMELAGFGPPQSTEWRYWSLMPTTLLPGNTPIANATDDWPFLYLRERMLPKLSVHSMLLLGVISIVMLFLLTPMGRTRGSSRMFFLGAAFLLLETKAVVNLALLFGGTWLVNSLVFFTVLTLILLANIYTLKVPGARLRWQYAGLFILLAANVIIPVDIFLNGGILWRYVAPCTLSLGPMFFAGVIFARSFRDSPDPDRALGANIAGSVVGGLSESFSMLLGFRSLLLLAMVFYALSALRPRRGA